MDLLKTIYKGPVVYRATVTSNNKSEYYTGIAGNSFKKRVNNHNYDFWHRSQKHSTTLSNHIWDLKENGEHYGLTWNLVETAPIINHTTRKCRLCNREKWHIMSTINNQQNFTQLADID